MKPGFLVISSLIWFQIMAPKAAFDYNPAGGARGKSANAELSAADVTGSQRIYGGNETEPHEFPFHVLFTKTGLPLCGAVIIDKEWALTAGHCAASTVNASYFTLYAGKHDKTIPESTEQKIGVVKVFRHEDYTREPSYRNDISLMKVSPPFQFNEYVQKVALPKRSDEKYWSGTATAVGWGRAEHINYTNVTNLRKVSLPLTTNDRCQELYDPLGMPGWIFSVHICAGGIKGEDSCGGDSGGPLLFQEDGEQVLIGLTSWGYKCGIENAPGVYTRVTEFLDWIKNKTGLDFNGSRQISVVETPGGSGTEDAVRAKISNSLAQTMCKGFDDYQREKLKLSPAFKVRPNSSEKCGWAKWSRCQDGGRCKPFNFATCRA